MVGSWLARPMPPGGVDRPGYRGVLPAIKATHTWHGFAMCANAFGKLRQQHALSESVKQGLLHPLSTLRLFFTENTPETPLA
jgi:hypothetical protein